MDEIFFCKECVNYLELREGFCQCDYDVWEEAPKYKTDLYQNVLYECTFGEKLTKLKEDNDNGSRKNR